MLVVDASVVVDLVAPDVPREAPVRTSFGKWVATGIELVAPGLLWLETENALITGIRRNRWDGPQADAAAALVNRLPVRRVDIDADQQRAFELARRYDNWAVYDMLYVAVAERLGAPFITADEQLLARLRHLGWVKAVGEA